MMNELYPIKFKPLLKERIWGGKTLSTRFNKPVPPEKKIGESWEISGVLPDVSIVANGFLKNNSLQEIIEIYMGDLVGDQVYQKFGDEFPLLIKFIDASDVLSIQVHPDDEKALERHNAYGKTEMWYVVDSEEGATLINGFKKTIDKTTYLDALASGTLKNYLNYEKISPGDVFFIPPGRLHAIGKGILLAEIQQTSDITYRIYDWERLDDKGQPRELHTELALDVINFEKTVDTKINYSIELNRSVPIVACNYFKTNVIELNKPVEKDFNPIDSFVIYICIAGTVQINYGGNKSETLVAGETILVPAILKNIMIEPIDKATLIEVYIPENQEDEKND